MCECTVCNSWGGANQSRLNEGKNLFVYLGQLPSIDYLFVSDAVNRGSYCLTC